jgi:hypothetical protein
MLKPINLLDGATMGTNGDSLVNCVGWALVVAWASCVGASLHNEFSLYLCKKNKNKK